MNSLLAAVRFLTRLPLPGRALTARETGRAAPWFPAIGLVIGILLLAAHAGFAILFPEPLARLLALVVLIALTGALHLDGLADTADAFYAGRDRESILAIMKDPHIGTMGVVAVVAVILLKGAALVALPATWIGVALLVTPIVSRGLMVVALALPPARPDGLVRVFADHRAPWDLPVATLVTLAAVGFFSGGAGLVALAAAALAAGLVLVAAWRRIRGVTGDICGAVAEIAEAAFLLALVAAAPRLSPPACIAYLRHHLPW